MGRSAEATKPAAPTAMSFAKLIAPADPISFLGSDFGKRWRHFPGDESKADAVFDWPALNRLLAMDVWNARNMTVMLDGRKAPPAAYCDQTVNRSMNAGVYPNRDKVMALLAEGASLVLNDVGSLAPTVQAVADGLKQAFNARASANLYYSQRARQAFDSHYDRHEVFALQIRGRKKWRVYKGRADTPIEHPRFLNVPQSEYDRMKGSVDQEVTTKAGDVLYLPRGQFHDAIATDDDSLHITFSVQVPMGLTLIQDMALRLIDEPAFRADLPRLDGPDGEAALRRHIDSLVARIAEIYGGDSGLAIAKRVIGEFSDGPSTPFRIPHHNRRR